MTFTLFSFAMLLICVLCIGKEVFRGFKGGLFSSLISIVTVVSSIICGVLLSGFLGEEISGLVLRDILNYEGYISNSRAIGRVFEFFVHALVAAFIFPILFIILRLIIKGILHLSLRGRMKRAGVSEGEQTKKSKLWGAVLGGLTGAIVAAAITSPIMGTLHMARDALKVVDVIDEDALLSTEMGKSVSEMIEVYAADIPGNFCYSLGGDLIFRHAAVGDFNGKSLSVVNEMKSLTAGLDNVLGIVERISADNLDFAEAIDKGEINAIMDSSEIMKTLIAEGISEFSISWLNEGSYLGIACPNFNDNIEPLVREMLYVCAGTNSYNVKDTVGMLVDILDVMRECGISVDSKTEDIDYYLLVTRICEVIDKYPSMQSVKNALLDLAINAFADTVLEGMMDKEHIKTIQRIADEAMRAYNIDTSDISVKKDQLKSGLSGILNEFGITGDSVVVELLTEKLITEAEINGGIDFDLVDRIMSGTAK